MSPKRLMACASPHTILNSKNKCARGAGLRDGNLLGSTVAKPEDVATNGEPNVAALAAAHRYGMSRDHAFVNSNKRTAFVAAELILQLNGWRLEIDDGACVITMLAVTTGGITEDAFLTGYVCTPIEKFKGDLSPINLGASSYR